MSGDLKALTDEQIAERIVAFKEWIAALYAEKKRRRLAARSPAMNGERRKERKARMVALFWEGKSHREIGAEVGLSATTVRRLLSHEISERKEQKIKVDYAAGMSTLALAKRYREHEYRVRYVCSAPSEYGEYVCDPECHYCVEEAKRQQGIKDDYAAGMTLTALSEKFEVHQLYLERVLGLPRQQLYIYGAD